MNATSLIEPTVWDVAEKSSKAVLLFVFKSSAMQGRKARFRLVSNGGWGETELTRLALRAMDEAGYT